MDEEIKNEELSMEELNRLEMEMQGQINKIDTGEQLSLESSLQLNALLKRQLSILSLKNIKLNMDYEPNSRSRQKKGILRMLKSYNVESPLKESKIMNIEELDFELSSKMSTFPQMNTGNPYYKHDGNSGIYGKDIGEDIDVLNEKFESLQRAFKQTAEEYENLAVLKMEESTLGSMDLKLLEDQKEDIQRKKEKSMYYKPSEEGVQNQRMFNSFNSTMMNVEQILSESTLSLSLIQKKLREYPAKIKALEDELQNEISSSNQKMEALKKELDHSHQKNDELTVKLGNLTETNSQLEGKIKELEEEKLIKELNAQLEAQMQKKKDSREIHYRIHQALPQGPEEEKAQKKNEKILLHPEKKGCCRVF